MPCKVLINCVQQIAVNPLPRARWPIGTLGAPAARKKERKNWLVVSNIACALAFITYNLYCNCVLCLFPVCSFAVLVFFMFPFSRFGFLQCSQSHFNRHGMQASTLPFSANTQKASYGAVRTYALVDFQVRPNIPKD